MRITCGNCKHFELIGNHYGECRFGKKQWIITDEGCKWGCLEVHRRDTCMDEETFEPVSAAAWRVIQKLKTRLDNPDVET